VARFSGVAHDDYLREPGPRRSKLRIAATWSSRRSKRRRASEIRRRDRAVSNVDVLWFGHFDLTNFMGIPGTVRACRLPCRARKGGGRGAAPTARERGSWPPDERWARSISTRVFDDRVRDGFRSLPEALAQGIAALKQR